jgi:hypothetical protein
MEEKLYDDEMKHYRQYTINSKLQFTVNTETKKVMLCTNSICFHIDTLERAENLGFVEFRKNGKYIGHFVAYTNEDIKKIDHLIKYVNGD